MSVACDTAGAEQLEDSEKTQELVLVQVLQRGLLDVELVLAKANDRGLHLLLVPEPPSLGEDREGYGR